MVDIFDNTILCKTCNRKMEKTSVNKNGLELRAIACKPCNLIIIHPADLNNMQNFNSIKDKTYNVKLRIIGNSNAISIPKEIVDFMHAQEKAMDNMVRLCFEDMHRLSLRFGRNNEGI